MFGCSRFWSICSNGQEYPMQCISGLVLDPTNDQCLAPSEVITCAPNRSPDQLYRSQDPFSCAKRPDGNYAAGPCAGQYFQCHQGNRNAMPCPASLVYNEANSACDYLENCRATLKDSGPKLELVSPQGNRQPDLNSKGVGNPPQRRSRFGSSRRNSLFVHFSKKKSKKIL